MIQINVLQSGTICQGQDLSTYRAYNDLSTNLADDVQDKTWALTWQITT